jgi:anti-sigma factor RsiW
MVCPIEGGDGAELIVAYGARTLAPDKEAELERHLSSCAKCRELAAAQRAVWSALDAWPPVAVSSNFDEKLYGRIAMEEQRAWWRGFAPANWGWRPAVPVAVACTAIIAAFLLKDSVLHRAAPSQNEPKLQIEQVEHALDDMDMLKQLSVDAAPDKTQPAERI